LGLSGGGIAHGQQAAIGAFEHGGYHFAQRRCTHIRLEDTEHGKKILLSWLLFRKGIMNAK